LRVLHTSDWHVGKRLERHDRMEEHRAAIAEVASIADQEDVDLVLHSGDLFDRSLPPVDALAAGLQGVVALTGNGRRRVVVVAGNHDSSDLFETLAPFLEPAGVHMVGKIKRPDQGGVLTLETAAGRAHVACFPFLRSSQAIDFMERTDAWYRGYANRVRLITERYSAYLSEVCEPGEPGFLVAHFMVGGVKVRTGVPRGERELHIGEAYAATAQAVPTGVDYVAMGHIHAPQPVPGAPVPAEYAGSLLQLDFGESGEEKRVVIVDTDGRTPASARTVPITAGRRLERARGRWEEVAAMDLEESYLDLTVETDGPDPGLLERARDRFPLVVKIRAEYPRPDAPEPDVGARGLDDLYAEYYAAEHRSAPPEGLLDLFRNVMEEAADAAR
jgi:exonuclease SbcD